MGHTPYELVYVKSVVIPIEFEIQILITTLQVGLDLTKAQQYLLQLNALDEQNKSNPH